MATRLPFAEDIAERTLQSLFRRGLLPVNVVELVLNDACNLSCKYCFEKGRTSQRRMPLEIGKASIDMLLASPCRVRRGIFFFGGEPFLSWHVMRDLIVYARSRESDPRLLELGMTTNGTFVPPGAPDFLRRNRVHVLVSMDPGESAHDANRTFRSGRPTFHLVRNNLLSLQNEGVQVSVRSTVTPAYLHALAGFVEECAALGVEQMVIGAALPGPWTEDDIQALVRQARKLSRIEMTLRRNHSPTHIRMFLGNTPAKACSAGKALIAVSPEGDVFGCSRLAMANNGKGAACLGDIRSFKPDASVQQSIAIGTSLSGCAAVNYEEHSDLTKPSEALRKIDDALLAVVTGHAEQRAPCCLPESPAPLPVRS